MRMQPLKFSVSYSNDSSHSDNEDTQYGFLPKQSEEENIWVMRVEMEFNQPANSSSYILFRIIEEVVPKTYRKINDMIHYDKPFDRMVYSCAIFAYPHSRSDDEFVTKPTHEQASLIEALACGDIRGEYANTIANQLYINLFVLNPKTDFGKYLPEVKKHFEMMVATGAW